MLWTANAQAELIDATEGAEAPVGAVRRLAVASLIRGVGVSTLTVLVAESLARNRSGRILIAERRIGHAATKLRNANTRGIETLSIDSGSTWEEQVAPIARNFDIVLTDGGNVAGIDDLTAVADSAHVLCLVTSDDRAAAEQVIALARGLHAHPAAPRPIVTFVDTLNVNSTWPALVAARLPFPVTRIPHDRALAATRAAPNSRTRRGALQTAAALLRTSEPGAVR
ncbi:hypothetical protein [Microterricola viridarii]|uniref:MinD-like ATPase involved in chromosome partitioning or flagellar assembly n=1 Tax=Microterricola viridarii TaxID=412690 RepID=A0A1H1NNC6_9MICO|nr:hypothetical protein [Microterricola viridarii]SDS00427.1 MinD-like ATPase involved in chromosome partitioning or flagellar assembly [Microterricola viridarii]